MPRPPRVHFPGALYHVIARGNRGQAIFRSDRDRRHLLASLDKVWQQNRFRLYAFVLMTNHLHLLIEVERSPLAKIMQSLLYRHSSYFNRTHKTRGHLFQGRYRAILCDRDAYLLELVRYLHLNPVRAGLVPRLDEYAWSSHPAYLGRERWPFLSTESVLGQFGKQRGVARARYRKFLEEAAGQGPRPDLYAVVDGRFLGEESFVIDARRHQRVDGETRPAIHISLEDLLSEVVQHCGIRSAPIHGSEKRRELVSARRIVALLAVEMGGYTQRQVASFLRCNPASVSTGMQELKAILGRDMVLARQVDGLKEKLRRDRRSKKRSG